MRIVLASASPRRQELLEQIGLKFEVAVSNVQEHVTASAPENVVEELSEQKAEAVFRLLEGIPDDIRSARPDTFRDSDGARSCRQDTTSASYEARVCPPGQVSERLTAGEESIACEEFPAQEEILVVGADTVVSVDGSILGKPADREDAVRMLAMLSGRSHEVYTGVSLIYRTVSGQIQRKTFHERTEVIFYPMSDEEIDGYVSTGDCMDKAGAYGIQGFCARYIKEIRGDYNNVVGLPAGRLYQEAKNLCGKNF